ncbi:uncharacterized protein Z519_06268 [Cladophialophora bantiana CBS 173.52]|uniref:Xylanolytic transcriptional activator regulatory domain-containing protein n=1 Tax=Cladophialophora bantiana (strain ATCC 10958 / CBS 173.52 / CDC B-1940 / NIH 8579) TaxID=1442370 RepID=A0A0D2HK55_CLAB1|nr:uncharacterized protein Z519_06268 [Cladophialophora bantiana CBS 173.52]KIW93663.1 hypothetical protein Z519_06268 [Cladophialophora bantiana CBS 173.52]
MLIGRVVATKLAQLYVSHFESTFRILHVPTFWREFERFWASSAEISTAISLQIHLVLAIGSSIFLESSYDDLIPTRSLVYQWAQSAYNWLSGPTDKGRLSIDRLQVQCLLVLTRQVLAIGADLLYITMGHVIRMAIQRGLHRDPRHFHKMTPLQSEMRRRLWATILELNLQAALDAGALPNFTLQDFDTESPANVNDSDLDDLGRVMRIYPPNTVTNCSLLQALFASLRPRYELARRMNCLSAPMSYEEIERATSDINEACRSYRSLMKGDDTALTFKQNLLELLLSRGLLKVSLDAAMAILSPFQNEEFSHLVRVGGGVFKSRLIHASLAVASELLKEIEENGVMMEPIGHRKTLVDAVEEALCRTDRRIQLGETNADVKMHMKLSMVICRRK